MKIKFLFFFLAIAGCTLSCAFGAKSLPSDDLYEEIKMGAAETKLDRKVEKAQKKLKRIEKELEETHEEMGKKIQQIREAQQNERKRKIQETMEALVIGAFFTILILISNFIPLSDAINDSKH